MITEEMKKKFIDAYMNYATSKFSAHRIAYVLIEASMVDWDYIEIDGANEGLFSSNVESYITGISKVDEKLYINAGSWKEPLHSLNTDEITELANYLIYL